LPHFSDFLLGFPSLRLSGPYLAITTIGFAEILRLVAVNWVDLTRGSLGLSGIPLLTPIRLGGWRMEFYFERDYYYVVLAAALIHLFLHAAIHPVRVRCELAGSSR
jgi:branched-chain amino acid transport system permease protein